MQTLAINIKTGWFCIYCQSCLFIYISVYHTHQKWRMSELDQISEISHYSTGSPRPSEAEWAAFITEGGPEDHLACILAFTDGLNSQYWRSFPNEVKAYHHCIFCKCGDSFILWNTLKMHIFFSKLVVSFLYFLWYQEWPWNWDPGLLILGSSALCGIILLPERQQQLAAFMSQVNSTSLTLLSPLARKHHSRAHAPLTPTQLRPHQQAYSVECCCLSGPATLKQGVNHKLNSKSHFLKTTYLTCSLPVSFTSTLRSCCTANNTFHILEMTKQSLREVCLTFFPAK